MSKNRIGIFGGSGYIGSAIAGILAPDFEVEIFDIKSPSKHLPRVVFRKCDIRDYTQVENCCKDSDVVISTAIIQIPLINEQKRLGYEVNYLGTQNVCAAVNKNQKTKGLILSGSWHTIGERELRGLINEEFGFRPDKVEERARLYAFSKIAQESIVRYYSEMSDKVFGIIRMGTVLGDGMPDRTAANIFIDRALKGLSITPFKHSMYRPMLYVDVRDICKAYKLFVTKILNGEVVKTQNSIEHIVNVYYPEPITIIDLAEIIKYTIMQETNNSIMPSIDIVDANQPTMFTEKDKKMISVDISKAQKFLGFDHLISPNESIKSLVKLRLQETKP